MIKTIRAAGFAAAAAFLCSANSAAAASNQDQVNPAIEAAAATATPITAPVTAPVLNPVTADAPAAKVEQAVVPADFAIFTDYSSANNALTPGRTRPDRPSATAIAPISAAEPAPAPAGVTAAAGDRRSLTHLVAEHSGAELDDEQFQCLASAVYFESRGEPLDGQLAVAEVILNRVKSGRFRSTICDVVKQPSQFSFVRRGVIPQPKRETAAWQRAVAIAHIALNELADVTGENSLFFHATYVNPRWGRPRVAKIGNHIFYR